MERVVSMSYMIILYQSLRTICVERCVTARDITEKKGSFSRLPNDGSLRQT